MAVAVAAATWQNSRRESGQQEQQHQHRGLVVGLLDGCFASPACLPACLRRVDVRGRKRRSVVCTIQPRTALDDAWVTPFPSDAPTTQIQPKKFKRSRAWRDGGCIVAVCTAAWLEAAVGRARNAKQGLTTQATS